MSSNSAASYPSQVRILHTLGPTGTNCEAAAREWFRLRGIQGAVVLHRTLEDAVETMPVDEHNALLGCVVYPDLHTLVFSNLRRLDLAECFVHPTFNMLLASRDGKMPGTVLTHPAPQHLVPSACRKILVTSNAQAAADCAAGKADGCITTLPAAEAHGLEIVEDFGPVPMGFTIHVNKAAAIASQPSARKVA